MTRCSPLSFNEQDGSIAFRDLLTIGVGPVCLEPSDVRNPSQKSVTYACEVDRRWRPRGVTRHGLPNESVQPSGWALVLNMSLEQDRDINLFTPSGGTVTTTIGISSDQLVIN